jgi:hypothetical protein
MMRRLAPSLWLLVLAAAACAGNDGAATATDEVAFSLDVDLPAGSEIHRCKFVTTPAAETFTSGASHVYSLGSHHMLLFRTDLTTIPAELAGVHDCYEAAASIMSHVRGVVYGAQMPTGEVHYPAGVGLPFKPSEVLLLQAHYINASDQARTARVDVKLLTTDPATVTERAGTLFFYDPFIVVPPNGPARASMSCSVRNDVRLLTVTSHMHRRGVGYRAFLDSAAGPASAPFYTTDSWDHPSQLTAALDVAAGSTIRFECDYMNEEPRELIQGQSAENNEMCMFTGVYYPAMGLSDELCLSGPHNFGTGTATCAQTLACIQSCPPGTTPMLGDVLSAGSIDVDECWQRCFVDSCPKAWAPFSAEAYCAQSMCATECSTGTGCAECAVAKCGAELTACVASGC